MAAGDTLRKITPNDQFILDVNGNVVGVKSPNANGADLRFDPSSVAITGGTIGGKAKILPSANRNVLPARLNVRQVMATPPTVSQSATATITGASRWFGSDNASFALGSSVNDWCSVVKAPFGAQNVTAGPAPTYGGNAQGYDFMHDGSLAFELIFGGTSTSYMLKVDDQYVSMTPQNVGASTNYIKYTFATIKPRRISIVGYNIAFVGINIGANDTITPAPVRGPRCIVVGDSFTAGSGASGVGANAFPAVLSDLLGWDDVWASGIGGTGYVATNGGSGVAYGTRLAHDVITYNPEVVWFVGSINDDGISTATVSAAALAAYQQIATALPKALIVASPNATGGVNRYTATKLATKDAMKAAVQSVGGVWVDPLERSIAFTGSSTLPTGTLRNAATAATAGSTGIVVYGFTSNGGYPQVGSTIEIGSGATRERLNVKSGSFGGSDGGGWFFTTTFDGSLQYSHSAGERWTQVGGSYLTGIGKVGATTGFGNADLYVSSDGTHPSDAGHAAFADVLATQLLAAIGPN